jgi:tetratricopeptide (TPR) repeat protein
MVLIEKGDQARAANRFPEARASYEEARTFLAKAGEPLILASVSRAIGESFTREGKLADAVPYLRGASETFRAAGNRRADAFALDALGATLFQLSRYDEAEATLREAIQEVQSTEGLAPKPMSYLNLASVLTYTGRCAEASAFATQASAIAEAQKDDKRVASAHLQRGAALECEGRFPDAIAAYEATVKTIGPSSPDERAAWALAGIAEVRALRGDLKTALEQADRSVAAQRATNQKLNVAFALVGRARIRRFAGDLGGADADIREARSAGGGADLTPDLRARIDLDAGVAALDAGDLPAAESGFRGAAAAPPAIDLEGFARAGLAESLCRTGRVDAGLVEAKGAASPPSTFAERLEASHALAECLLAAGDKAESAAAARRYLRDAQAAGARWAVVLAAVDLAKASSREGSDAKARGRRALFELIRAAPGGESGGFAHRTVVRDAKKFLGSS